ncbi:helix-turn-helix protein [Spirosoma oryzae]|uniref:Helix-turn-helix protein n=1 Tax=Spirosoma oryzae TaxID=1469603 RepID=A0A2T0RIU1_9BACT|nr:helix-turn-helix transcriptional regulator [Spirosoma oryzae]PRY21124.1 helix-turn-helix protein [Spirosoma oryzae]
MSQVYANIKAIRTEKGLKQEDVAQKMGMAQSNYARLEKGLTQATIERLEQLADIFAIPVSSILSYETGTESGNEDISYYINLCRKYEKQVDTLRKRVSELEEESLQDWGKLNDELKVAKEKNRFLADRLKEKDRTIQILEKALDALTSSKQDK